MNRRDFLLTTTGLTLIPAITQGQATSAPASSDIVFANFESGTYDAWTLTGNCWTPEAYSDRYFPGKITGYLGKYFLCTLHPRLGSAATGRAVSKEFTIEKPFINFLIGGGNHPSEACLNLVVDGKVVRSATGRDSAELSLASWDVSLLAGKKAHIEVVDATSAADRGYIMVDDIRFAERTDTVRSLPASKEFSEINEIVTRHIKKYAILGGAAAVTWRGNLVFSQGYGFSDREQTRVFTVDTPCRIGSISKCLTALAVVKLVEQGKLNLSTRVIPYLGLTPLQASASIGENVTSITVRQLLHHISGFRNGLPDWRIVAEGAGKPGDKLTDEDYLRYLIQFRTESQPGTEYVYSNNGYVILGLLVTKASGTSYEEYVTKEILTPLGMKNTFMGIADGQSNVARGETCYVELGQPDPFKDRVVLRLAHAAGGWVASISDLAKLIGFVSNYSSAHPPISRASLQSMTTRPPIANLTSWYYGYGFFIDELPGRGGVRFSHAGLHLNAYGYLFGDPEGMAVAVLFNTNETSQTLFNKELIPRLQTAAANIARKLLGNGA